MIWLTHVSDMDVRLQLFFAAVVPGLILKRIFLVQFELFRESGAANFKWSMSSDVVT